jgi:hypothetical protein
MERITIRPLAYLAALCVLAVLVFAPTTVVAQPEEDLYDCSDFVYQEDAQEIYDEDPTDPYGLDGAPGEEYAGVEGVACEALPHRGDAEESGNAQEEEPDTPECGWYESWNEEEEWWEYWCYWPEWGWEYVFWSY